MQLFMCARVLRKHDHAVGGLDQRALFDDEVEAVIDGVDQKHVEVSQRRHRLPLALPDLEAYRQPARASELGIGASDRLADQPQVAAVDGDVLP